MGYHEMEVTPQELVNLTLETVARTESSPHWLRETARLLIKSGDSKKAKEIISMIGKEIETKGYSFECERWGDLVEISRLCVEIGDLPSAARLVEKAAACVVEFQADSNWLGDKSKVLAGVAHVHYLMNDKKAVSAFLSMAVDTSRMLIRGTIDRVEALRLIADIWRRTGDISNAERCLDEAVSVIRVAISGPSQIEPLLDCADLYRRINHQETSLALAEEALSCYEEFCNEEGFPVSTKVKHLVLLSDKLALLGQMERAGSLTAMAMEIIGRLEDLSYDNVYGVILVGYALWRVDKKDKAINMLHAVLKSIDEDRVKYDAWGKSEFYAELARKFAKIGEFRTSLMAFSKMVDDDIWHKLEALEDITRIYIEEIFP